MSIGIKAADLQLLDRIFLSKAWDRTDLTYSSAYEAVAEMLSTLNNPQKDLLIELVKKFSKYESSKYVDLFRTLFLKITEDDIGQYKKIIFTSLKFPLETPKEKSSDISRGLCRYAVIPLIPAFKDKKQIHLTSPIEIKNYPLDKETLVIIIDDFIGSGRTAKRFCEEYKNKFGVKENQILIISLVCMRKAKEYLDTQGWKVLSLFLEDRGISDNADITDKAAAFFTINSIHEQLDIDMKYYKGYGDAEALVSTMNTPNNTFPIFWVEKMKTGQSWPVIFKRV